MTRFLRVNEVVGRTGLSRTVIYKRIREGTFPQSVPLGDSPTRYVTGWVEAEIEAWCRERIRAARGPEPLEHTAA